MEKLNVLDKKKVKELFMTGEIKSHTDVLELNKILFKELMESMLEAEMDDHLGYEKHEYKAKKTDNSRNGTSAKTVRAGDLGEVPIEIPRDRKGEFEPILIPKYESSSTLYGKGLTNSNFSPLKPFPKTWILILLEIYEGNTLLNSITFVGILL